MEALHIRQTGDGLATQKGTRRESSFSLLASIGNTPLVQIRQMTRHLTGRQAFTKPEWLNPGL